MIDSPADYTILANTYPHRDDNPRNPTVPNWRTIAEEGRIDAVHVTAQAVSDKNIWYAKSREVESTLRARLLPFTPSFPRSSRY